MAKSYRSIPNLPPQDLERFWSHVDQASDDECWEWQSARDWSGYGAFQFKGQTYKAHRTMYFLQRDTQPALQYVCHHCDNPPCVNPKHLFLGTAKDNARDCSEKGRHVIVRGEAVGGVKLTAKQVLAIRAEVATHGTLHKDLAAQYGVSRRTITAVVNRTNWKHLP